MDKIKRILVVSRMSSYCEEAIRFGMSLAQRFEAHLSVIHVLYHPFSHMNMPIMSIDEEHRKDLRKVQVALDEIIEKERRKGIPIETIVVEGEPIQLIEQAIAEGHIDLVVLHAHADTYWEHFIYGYSNEEIVKKIRCSVLVVKDQPGKHPVPDRS